MPFARIKQKQSRVIVQFQGVPSSEKDCRHYLNLLQVIYDADQEFVILFDAREIGWIPFKYIRLQTQFMRQHEEHTRRLMKRAAIVVQTAAAQTVLKTIFKLRRPASPCCIFRDITAAKLYLQGAAVNGGELFGPSVDDSVRDKPEDADQAGFDDEKAEEEYMQVSAGLVLPTSGPRATN